MNTLTRADEVIVVLSNKCLRSANCMRELYGICRRSQ